MLENLELIIPMLEKITDGALWAFISYIIAYVVTAAFWPLVFVILFVTAGKVIRSVADAPEVKTIRMILKDSPGRRREFMGSEEKIYELFSLLNRRGIYINDSDVQAAIDKLEKANESS